MWFDSVSGLGLFGLGLLTLLEIALLRKVYSRLLMGYIVTVAILFVSVALEHLNDWFSIVAMNAILVTFFFKVYLFWVVRGKVSSKHRSKYMGDIYKTVGFLHGESKERKVSDKAAKHKEFIQKYAANVNGLLVVRFDGTIEYVNEPLAAHLGLKTKELIGENYNQFISEAEIARTVAAWDEGKLNGELKDFLNHWTVNGTDIPMYWITCFNDTKAEIAYCVVRV